MSTLTYTDPDTFVVTRQITLNRIALSPWSKDRATDPDELLRLDARAASLGLYVSTIKRTTAPAGWVVRVFQYGFRKVETVRSPGVLSAVIEAALDKWEATHRGWTADELLTVAAQSGMDVRRA